jgi:hypothetical protein
MQKLGAVLPGACIALAWMTACFNAAPCAAAGITELFDSIKLIPASSGVDHSSAQKDKAHFPCIQQETGVAYSDMLFFDDESPNIVKVHATLHGGFSGVLMLTVAITGAQACVHAAQVSRLGVTSILAPSGVSVQLFEKGLREHAKRRSNDVKP